MQMLTYQDAGNANVELNFNFSFSGGTHEQTFAYHRICQHSLDCLGRISVGNAHLQGFGATAAGAKHG